MSALDEMVNPRSGASVDDKFIFSVPADVARQARAELAATQSMLARWKRAIEGLTPGGSEFADDPERCALFIRDRTNYPRQIVELRTELARLRAIEQAARQLAGEFRYTNAFGSVYVGRAEYDALVAALGQEQGA